MQKEYTIVVLCWPSAGHLNPISCLAGQLAKYSNLRVIFYGLKQDEQLIESTGAEFREYFIEPAPKWPEKDKPGDFRLFTIFEYQMRVANKLVDELIRCIEEEHVDLVVYDFMTIYAKWIMNIYQQRHKMHLVKRSPPLRVSFFASFVMQDEIYPNIAEQGLRLEYTLNFRFIFNLLKFACKYIYFHLRHRIRLEAPYTIWLKDLDGLNLCAIMPELQPRSHLFPKSVKFIGSCASEEIRLAKEFDEPLNSFLEPFVPRNPIQISTELKLVEDKSNDHNENDLKLVYASFGTVFNKKFQPFIEIINAFSDLSSKVRVLISAGDHVYNRLIEMKMNGQLKFADHILVMRRVPQLDVLKRASLFISHCGQNGVSESIHYGVPILAIPVSADQPAVAYRVADELGLGIRLSLNGLNSNQIREAALHILNDKSYLERVCLYSKLSRKYDGPLEGSRLIVDYLQNNRRSSSINYN